MTGLEWTHKCSKRNLVINIQDFPARNASGRASIALRRSTKAVPACRRWSPPASCTCTCGAAVDAILHSFKNSQVVILDNDRSLSRITTCKCALWNKELHENGPKCGSMSSGYVRSSGPLSSHRSSSRQPVAWPRERKCSTRSCPIC